MSKVTTVAFKDADNVNYTHSFDFANFAKSVGSLISKYSFRIQFVILGVLVTIPKTTNRNDNKDRVLSFLRSLVAGMFGNLEVHENLPKTAENADRHAVLASLQKAGFKFQNPNKIEVSKAVELWYKSKQAKKKVAEQLVTSMNLKMMAETNVLNDVAKVLKADNLSKLTGIEAKIRTKYGYLTAPKVETPEEVTAE